MPRRQAIYTPTQTRGKAQPLALRHSQADLGSRQPECPTPDGGDEATGTQDSVLCEPLQV